MIPVVLRGLPTRAAMGTLALLASCAHGALPPPAQPAAPSVDVREETLTLPTYGVKPDPFPFFRATHGTMFYPYPRYDILTHEKQDRTYRALVLENEFLRVTVLPELGGRVHSVFDKKAGREMFYRNDVVEPARIAPRGAGLVGGLSFQFQDGPVPGPFDPVHATLERHPDGSASVVLGDIEHITGLQWKIALTLRAAWEALMLDIRVFNRTTLRQRFRYGSVAELDPSPPPTYVVFHLCLAQPLGKGTRSHVEEQAAAGGPASRRTIRCGTAGDTRYTIELGPHESTTWTEWWYPVRQPMGAESPALPHGVVFPRFQLRGRRWGSECDPETNEGTTALRRAQWEHARSYLQDALRVHPADDDIRYGLAIASRNLGLVDNAWKGFEALSERSEGWAALGRYFMGELALRRRDWAGGAMHFQSALEKNPDDLRAAANLLIAQARMQFDGLTKDAPDRAVLERGLALDPLDLPLRFAERFMNRDYGVTDLIPDDRCGLFSTLEFLDLGFLRVPVETGMRCRDAVPLARIVAADCAAQMGGWYYGMLASTARAEARRDAHLPHAFPAEAALLPALEREAGRDPKNGRIHYYRGCLLLSLDRGEEAAAAFEKAAALGDDTAHLHRNLGLVRWKVMKDPDGGARHLERAVALAPKEAQPVLELDELLEETGQRDRRVDLLEGALGRIAWRKGDVAGRLAEAYAAVERYDDAAAMLDSADFDDFGEAEKLRDLHVRVHLERGNAALAATGDLARARAAYEVAAGYPPNLLMAPPAPRHRRDARALWKLALACEGLGDAAAAERARREILPEEHAPDSPLAVYKGLALRALGDAPAAERLFGEMIAAAERFKDSDPARRRLLLGLGLWGHGRRDEAAPHLEAALSRGANYEIGREFLGEK